MRLTARLIAASLLVLAAGTARAQPMTAPMPAVSPTEAAAPPPGWSFSLTPYAWLPALRGSLQTPLPNFGERGFTLSSGTVFTDLSTVPVMVTGEARYGRFALVGDLFYAGLQQDIQTPHDLLWQGGHVRTVSTIGTLLGMVRVVETPNQGFELGAGVRLWNFNNKVSLNPGLVGGVINKSGVGWADPLVAARYTAMLSPAFGVTVYGDIGGFDTGSRLTWQVMGSLDYSLAQATKLRAGWRYLSVDKSRGSVGVDLSFNGPFFALTFGF